MIRQFFNRRQVQLLSSTLVVFLCLYTYYSFSKPDNHHFPGAPVTKPTTATDTPLPVPNDYAATSSDSKWCQDRFGLRYLENARNLAGSYCTAEAKSSLNCFWSQTEEGRIDTTCFSTRAVFDPERRVFHINCPLREITPEEVARGLPRIPDDLHSYWYETGPRQIFDKSLFLDGGGFRKDADRTTILVKREGSHNLWHSLMEIMALSWSLDLLQMSQNAEGVAYLSTSQMNSTQVIIIDDLEPGPYIDLWRIFAQMPIRRLSELSSDEPPSNVIVPLVGGSNPLWQGDWKELSCTEAPLLRTFIRRVLDLYKILDADEGSTGADVAVTFVDRKGSRELVDQDAHIEALRKAVPHMQLEVVDFASMPLAEQIKVARRTDVLVGVHGAGLTHAMFMKPGSVLVEILPIDFTHKGFRNLAQMLGHRYFRTHAKTAAGSSKRDWQQDPVQIDRQTVIDVVRAGVQAMYSRGGRSFDVS
ncbi:hypothetical protein NQ176_g2048 [Zarea fungicola]|uniref:Uncharacterized protein n=1 Tax=Zarea fungicola TaxID=93591 RepID=A0ACC1NQN9_9HYPO|nr:hypothetical protein NQ176_g2048 [Lecanicillium fungicola]